MNNEFNNGWNAGAQDDYIGNGRRSHFASYRTADFIRGYNAFWDKQADEVAVAELDCIADYDNNAGHRS